MHLPAHQHLEVVSRGVAEEAEVLLLLADDLVDDRAGDPVGAEAAGSEVVAVVDELLDRFFLGHALVGHGARLLAEELASLVRIGVCEDRVDPLV